MQRRRFLALAGMGLLSACTNRGTAETSDSAAGSSTSSVGTTSATTTATTLQPSTTQTAATAWTSDGAASDPFALGVASGDPDQQSVILWTRLTGDAPVGDVNVSWDIATDAAFTQIIQQGDIVSSAGTGGSLSVLAEGLGADQWYFYRFTALGVSSPTGRTRTMPLVDSTPDVFAVVSVSCQDYQRGEYAALRGIADSSADLLVFLGDFIYASATHDYGGRTHGGPAPEALEEYRDRYALYLSDPSLRAARASLPWVAIWDDNEVAPNYAGRVPEIGPGYQAWFEHVPNRGRQADPTSDQIYRSVSVGDLVDISLLDGRQYRSAQACGTGDLGAAEDCPERHLEERTMLGDAQERWLDDSLSQSRARWQFVAQQTMIARLELNLGGSALYNSDQWDGYTAARTRLMDSLARASSPVVLSGDLHAATVAILPGQVAAEFVAPSISSSIADRTALGLGVSAALQPDVLQLDTDQRGYLHLEITPDRIRVVQMAVADAWDPQSPVSPVAAWELLNGEAVPRPIEPTALGE
jgi:alkaline phosphatase D